MVTMVTILEAKRIVTMNPGNPYATHIAIKDGIILGVGPLEELTGWGEYKLDRTFADQVFVPGFVEAHAHVMAGGMLLLPFMGYYDRYRGDGSLARGIKSYDALIEALREEEGVIEDPDQPLVAVGFDPIYFGDQPRLSRHHLDQVSTTRPIFIYHASGHLATVNSAMLAAHQVTKDIQVEGLGRDADGELDGELREPPAMSLCRSGYGAVQRVNNTEAAMVEFGKQATNCGITTCTDLGGLSLLSDKFLAPWQSVTRGEHYPLRVAQYNIGAIPGSQADCEAAAERLMDIRKDEHEKLRFPGVKFILDGSIQGFSALLNPPGYFQGSDHGQLLVVPEQLQSMLQPFHARGINIHMHCNGNATQDLAIDTIDQLLRAFPWFDHRHTITHAQLTTQAQLRKMANLGLCANFFSNHLWYWGDQHYEITVGPERAHQLEPCASAVRAGVPFSVHSDAGVTPLGSLHTMWCAVNRMTPSGRTLGEEEKISPLQGLKAVTIDAAYQLHLDHEIGSLEAGKKADIAILAEDPLSVDPMHIKDIDVLGTFLAGELFPAAGSNV
ncbi:MAG: amidohydrolase [Gammaproteobacteria bacterium]|nr:amidohydrolase [Gammaproteobacteria bacterium]